MAGQSGDARKKGTRLTPPGELNLTLIYDTGMTILPGDHDNLSATAPMTMNTAPRSRKPVTFSFRKTADISMTKRMLVSRSAATAAMGARLIAQMTIQ